MARCSTPTGASEDPDGSLALPGLVFLGDAVCTTTPNFGRGLATTMLQVDELLRLLETHTDPGGTPQRADLVAAGRGVRRLDRRRMMRPWVEDHGVMDESLRRRWGGEDIDPSGPIPSNLIMEAAAVDPRIEPAIGPYVAMQALPTSLRAVEPYARAVYESRVAARRTPTDRPEPSCARVVADAVT